MLAALSGCVSSNHAPDPEIPSGDQEPALPDVFGGDLGNLTLDVENLTGSFGIRITLRAIEAGRCTADFYMTGKVQHPGIQAYTIWDHDRSQSPTLGWTWRGATAGLRADAAEQRIEEGVRGAVDWVDDDGDMAKLEAGETARLVLVATNLALVPVDRHEPSGAETPRDSPLLVRFSCEGRVDLAAIEEVSEAVLFTNVDVEGPVVLALDASATASASVEGKVTLDVTDDNGLAAFWWGGDLLAVHAGAGRLILQTPEGAETFLDGPSFVPLWDITRGTLPPHSILRYGVPGPYTITLDGANFSPYSYLMGILAGYGPWPPDRPMPRIALEGALPH